MKGGNPKFIKQPRNQKKTKKEESKHPPFKITNLREWVKSYKKVIQKKIKEETNP